MKLMGRDIPARELLARIEERLRTRGLPTSEQADVPAQGVEPRVDPLSFNLQALEENSDATRALPLHTHRGGAGQLARGLPRRIDREARGGIPAIEPPLPRHPTSLKRPESQGYRLAPPGVP